MSDETKEPKPETFAERVEREHSERVEALERVLVVGLAAKRCPWCAGADTLPRWLVGEHRTEGFLGMGGEQFVTLACARCGHIDWFRAAALMATPSVAAKEAT